MFFHNEIGYVVHSVFQSILVNYLLLLSFSEHLRFVFKALLLLQATANALGQQQQLVPATLSSTKVPTPPPSQHVTSFDRNVLIDYSHNTVNPKAMARTTTTTARDRLQVAFNRLRQPRPERRLFYPFNQLLLSLVAPRMMRYQFDMMMHSVLAELFKKVMLPAFGTAAAGGSGSIFSTLGSLLRSRQQQAQQQPNSLQSSPSGGGSSGGANNAGAQNIDIQRLLENAQRIVSLQNLLRGNNNNQVSMSSNNKTPSNKDVTTSNNNKANDSTQPRRQGGARRGAKSSTTTTTSTTTSKPVEKAEAPSNFAISPKDLFNFIQTNLRLNPKQEKGGGEDVMKAMSSLFRRPPSTITSSETLTHPKGVTSESQKAQLEDFKMSHLSYIDAEVPNYGNQLLVKDAHDGNSFMANKEQELAALKDITNHMSLVGAATFEADGARDIGSPSPSPPPPPSVPKNDELERANRWNNVLVNMKLPAL